MHVEASYAFLYSTVQYRMKPCHALSMSKLETRFQPSRASSHETNSPSPLRPDCLFHRCNLAEQIRSGCARLAAICLLTLAIPTHGDAGARVLPPSYLTYLTFQPINRSPDRVGFSSNFLPFFLPSSSPSYPSLLTSLAKLRRTPRRA